MANEGGIFLGTELKYAITITADGFDMDRDGWTVEIIRGKNSRVFDKEECFQDEQGQWYVAFGTAEFGAGQYYAAITAFVPDDDFKDGFRTEITVVRLLTVEAI